MALLCKYRLGLFTFVFMCVLLSAIRLAKDHKSVGGAAVMELEKADHHKAGHNAFISHREESPGDGVGNLGWMDYSSTRRKTPIHN